MTVPALVGIAASPAVRAAAPAVARAIGSVAGKTFSTTKAAWDWAMNNPLKSTAVTTAILAIPEVAEYVQKEGQNILADLREHFSGESVDQLERMLPKWAAARRAELAPVEKDAEATALDLEQAVRADVYQKVASRLAARFHINNQSALVQLREDIGLMLELPGPSWAYVSGKAMNA